MARLTAAMRGFRLLPFGLTVLGCASGGTQLYEDSAYGADSPEAAVTRFLEAANQSEYRVMANLFGTGSGPAERKWGRAEVEQRMFILAALLRHRSHELRRLNLTEGPDRIRVFADLVGTSRGDVTVPFITVAFKNRWLIEQIVTETLAGNGE